MSYGQTDDDIAKDTLQGASAIAAHIGKTERQVQYLLEHGNLPAFKLSGSWHMRKSTYRSFIAQLEAKAIRAA